MATGNFCFSLQNRLIQTSQIGGQWYSDTSPFSIPWLEFSVCTRLPPKSYICRYGQELASPFKRGKIFYGTVTSLSRNEKHPFFFFQAICYPLSNHRWTIHKSHTMLGIAWVVSLLFSAPQAGVFHAKDINYCRADFAPDWGAKVSLKPWTKNDLRLVLLNM
jgi:hypothetical protein